MFFHLKKNGQLTRIYSISSSSWPHIFYSENYHSFLNRNIQEKEKKLKKKIKRIRSQLKSSETFYGEEKG